MPNYMYGRIFEDQFCERGDMLHEVKRDKRLDRIVELEAERDRLREALSWYADKEAWHKAVLDSLSGELDFFDWPGDLADEPWEIAEKALTGREE